MYSPLKAVNDYFSSSVGSNQSKLKSVWANATSSPKTELDKRSYDTYLKSLRWDERDAETKRMDEIKKQEKIDFDKQREKDLLRIGPTIRPPSFSGQTPIVVKALDAGQSVGGTKTAITNPTGTYFVESTQQGPKISVATQQGTRTSSNATNITPIVNYKEAPVGSSPIINKLLVDNAKKFQENLTGQLVNSVYSGMAAQTTAPEYSMTETGIQAVQPLVPITKEQIDKKIQEDLELEKNTASRLQQEKELEAAQKLEAQKRETQTKLDKQAKINAEIEAKRIADEKAAEAARFRSQQQFDYDTQIESALKAAEGNSSLARRQFSAYEDRQKTMDAEKLAQQRAKRGNPAGYAGGFAQKAIQPTPATPAAIKAPAMKAPQPPATIEPTANKVSSSFLPPKVDGLQFGGN
jgi:hypothetical protein